jgi:hypothetical protein
MLEEVHHDVLRFPPIERISRGFPNGPMHMRPNVGEDLTGARSQVEAKVPNVALSWIVIEGLDVNSLYLDGLDVG